MSATTNMPIAQHKIELRAGTINVTVHDQHSAEFPLEALCDFAARNNPKRGFLVVSRVLGRHIPTAPGTMDKVHMIMANQIASNEDLPGPVVFIGMAETAVCLGQAIHQAYRAATGRKDTMFIHSTRQIIETTNGPAPVLAQFSEPHSHAAAHIVYEPLETSLRIMLAGARSLVLIDDETSTGTTFLNATQALAPHMPRLENVTTAVITDWSPDQAWRRKLTYKGYSHSMLRGALAWTPNPDFVSPKEPVRNTGALGRVNNYHDYGRRGISEHQHTLPYGHDYDHLAGEIAMAFPSDRYLILGTGEFTYPPFLLAKAMAAAGHDVVLQSTSRSPVHQGGAIKSVLQFEDNYDTGVLNYLYNAMPQPGTKVIICCETGANSIDQLLSTKLDAVIANFGGTPQRMAA